MGAALCGLVALVLAGGATAQADVYRCTGADGSIEFRQHPCQRGADSRKVQIRDTRTGWVPPSPEPESESEQNTREPRPKAARATNRNEATERDAKRCWKKRQQIQGINNELRAGYRPARGERLKRRRRELEAYVDEFCR
ncbi:DUF4124 domain-containing protein [uncultured Thiohalocapsa sp.]|uniref:DUF4124 domain-containing protein n=1 Tax=uncultured Thiohalocapsa sp. TaxID=768990 RepID=UPI0025EF721D|nr:DUF4124 domain-containing protein [uncultured Thiohalocapsa sp.]